MKCKKCGGELMDNCELCPKCENKIGHKKGLGTIIILLLLFIVVGVGGILIYMSKSGDQAASDKFTEEAGETEEIDEIEDYFLSLTFESVDMIMGETHQILLEKKMTDAVWVSSDEKIVQVTDGVIKALAPGKVTITISLDENQKFFDVVVNPFEDMTLAVNCSKLIELNDRMTNVRWESSAPEIVSVSEGTINSLSVGASVITAYIDEVPYSFEVVTTTPDISTTSVRKVIGNTQQISILGTNGQVEWKSDNTAIATVSENGLITAEATGAGQSTVVHAYVDGMEFKIDVAVEPIPQLSSTYKIYGREVNWGYDAKVTLCANANEIAQINENDCLEIKSVLNVADADYSDGKTFPLYRAFTSVKNTKPDEKSYVEVYLLGTSQKADVLIQGIGYFGLSEASSEVTYKECDGYGVITIYKDSRDLTNLVTVSVDGYKYEFVVEALELVEYHGGLFEYTYMERIPMDFVVEVCTKDEVVIQQATDSSVIVASSRTYHTNNNWIERIGTKFVQEVEDQAIELAAAALLKFILPF